MAKQRPLRLWYEKLKKGLEDRGFKTSQVDPCLFISKTVIVVAYVDDCLIFSKNKSDIDKLIRSFKEDGDEFNWEMKVNKMVHEFLGIEVITLPDGAVQVYSDWPNQQGVGGYQL